MVGVWVVGGWSVGVGWGYVGRMLGVLRECVWRVLIGRATLKCVKLSIRVVSASTWQHRLRVIH